MRTYLQLLMMTFGVVLLLYSAALLFIREEDATLELATLVEELTETREYQVSLFHPDTRREWHVATLDEGYVNYEWVDDGRTLYVGRQRFEQRLSISGKVENLPPTQVCNNGNASNFIRHNGYIYYWDYPNGLICQLTDDIRNLEMISPDLSQLAEDYQQVETFSGIFGVPNASTLYVTGLLETETVLLEIDPKTQLASYVASLPVTSLRTNVQSNSLSPDASYFAMYTRFGNQLILTNLNTNESSFPFINERPLNMMSNVELTSAFWIDDNMLAITVYVVGEGNTVFIYQDGVWSDVMRIQDAVIDSIYMDGYIIFFPASQDRFLVLDILTGEQIVMPLYNNRTTPCLFIQHHWRLDDSNFVYNDGCDLVRFDIESGTRSVVKTIEGLTWLYDLHHPEWTQVSTRSGALLVHAFTGDSIPMGESFVVAWSQLPHHKPPSILILLASAFMGTSVAIMGTIIRL